jgi:CRISPR system Cascade subunit CasA
VADLLAAALARNAAVAEAAAKYRTALATAKAARVPPGASLTLTSEYANDPNTSSPWLFGAGSDIPLDVGARRSTRTGAADLAAVQALHDYAEAAWSVRTALQRAVAERTAADAERVLAGEWTTLRQQRLDRLERRVAAGADDRALALTARADLNAAHRREIEAAGRRQAADAALAQALGVAPAAVADMVIAPPTPGSDPSDLPARRRTAALSRRDVLKAIVDYDLAENALRLEVAKQYPEVRLGPGYTWERGLTKLPFNLNLALPPWDMNRAAIAQAEAKRLEAAQTLEAVQAAALGAVDQAAAALKAARASEATAQRDLPNALRQAASADRAAKAGETDRVEALQAKAAVIETRLAASDARKALALAVIDLEDALRTPFDPAETAVVDQSIKALEIHP